VWNYNGGNAWSVFKIYPCSATSFKRPRWELSTDVAEHRSTLKNDQNKYNPRFSFIPRTGIAFPRKRRFVFTGYYPFICQLLPKIANSSNILLNCSKVVWDNQHVHANVSDMSWENCVILDDFGAIQRQKLKLSTLSLPYNQSKKVLSGSGGVGRLRLRVKYSGHHLVEPESDVIPFGLKVKP